MKSSVVTPILLLSAGVAAVYYAGAKNFADQLQFNFTGSKFDLAQTEAADYNFLVMDIQINLINPTSFSITIENISFDILHQNKKIATVTGNKKFNIAADKTTPYLLHVTVPTKNILNQAMEIAKDYIQTKQVSVTLAGKIKLAFGSIPFNKSIDLV